MLLWLDVEPVLGSVAEKRDASMDIWCLWMVSLGGCYLEKGLLFEGLLFGRGRGCCLGRGLQEARPAHRTTQ